MGYLVKRSLIGFSVATLLVGLGLVAGPRSAQADPHAVFLTVIGQQQFFFNVLAALNQADYVESLQLRDQLAKKRDGANYSPSSASALRESKTDLADLLTRSVSLEGQDVRTQERSDDYAQEVVRQRRLAELFEQLCREGFGSEECIFKQEKPKPGEEKKLLEERQRAFVQDPVEFKGLPTELGALAALSSGTKEHEDAAKETLKRPTKDGQTLPFAYSPEIAQIRKALKDAKKDDLLKKFNEKVKDVERTFKPPVFDINTWVNELEVGKDGKLRLHTVTGCVECAGHSAFGIIAHVYLTTQAGITLDGDLRRIAIQAQDRVAAQLQDTIVDGAVPDRVHKSEPGVGGVNNTIGEIATLVSAPANVKVGLQQQLLPLLAQAEANPQFIDPSQVDNPAGRSAVDKVDEKGNQLAPLKIGEPLEPFAKADINEKGLLQQSGVTEKVGMEGRNFLQKFLEGLVKKI